MNYVKSSLLWALSINWLFHPFFFEGVIRQSAPLVENSDSEVREYNVTDNTESQQTTQNVLKGKTELTSGKS